MARNALAHSRFYVTGLFVLILDWFTKWLIYTRIPAPEEGIALSSSTSIPLFTNLCGIDLSLTHAANTGAAWGIFADDPYALLCVRIVLIISLAIYALYFNARPGWEIPFALIVSGAIGNVVDFFTYGYVIDMIHVVIWGWDYPIFNVADCAIFIGTFWIFFSSLTKQSPHATPS